MSLLYTSNRLDSLQNRLTECGAGPLMSEGTRNLLARKLSHRLEVTAVRMVITIHTHRMAAYRNTELCCGCPQPKSRVARNDTGNTYEPQFISVINQIDAQNFCFTIGLFHASTCFEHMCSSSGGRNCITQPLVSSNV